VDAKDTEKRREKILCESPRFSAASAFNVLCLLRIFAAKLRVHPWLEFFVFSAVTQHSLSIPVNESIPQKAQFTPKNPQSVPYSLSFCPISVKYCLEF
jgi:hypothetical protein